MKSKTTLEKSYEKQKAIYDSAREEKIKNLKEIEENLLKKLERLNFALEQNRILQKKILTKEFPTFEDFFRKTELQSNEKRATGD